MTEREKHRERNRERVKQRDKQGQNQSIGELTRRAQTEGEGGGWLAVHLAAFLLLRQFLRHAAEVQQAVAEFVVQAEEEVPVGVAKEQRVVLLLLQPQNDQSGTSLGQM